MGTTYLKYIEKLYIEKKYGKELAKGEKYAIVLEDKHGTDLYLVASVEQLLATSLKILKERFKQGHYHDPAGDEPEKPSASKEQIDALPAGKLKDAGLNELRQYTVDYKIWQNAVFDYQKLLEMVNNNNGSAAFVFLENRGYRHEYEGFRVEHLHEIK